MTLGEPVNRTLHTLALLGALAALSVPSLAGTPGGNYCVGAPNSTGLGASMGSSGSNSVSQADFTLVVSSLPANSFGVFYYGGGAVQAPFGNGFRCVGEGTTGIFRLKAVCDVDPVGVATLPLDFGRKPVGSGPGTITAGSTWFFQFLYRDGRLPATAGFNLSDGYEQTFAP